jgi:hypothetical protein
MDPLTAALLSALASSGIQAIGNISQGRAQERERRGARQFEQRRNTLIDELLASVEGKGKFSDLFKTDEAAFQKSFVDPAKKLFSSQIAPQIQQGAIAGGTQLGTTTEDALTRAGVDLDSMLNQQFMQFQQGGQDRIGGVLSSILGMSPATPFTAPPTGLQTLGAGASGFLQSPGFAELLKNAYSQDQNKSPTPQFGGSSVATQPVNSMSFGGFDEFNARPGFGT